MWQHAIGLAKPFRSFSIPGWGGEMTLEAFKLLEVSFDSKSTLVLV